MNEMKKHYIGIDIGGTKCAVTLGDADGNILLKERFLTESPDVTVVRILDAARTLMARSDAPVLSAGISCGGPLDPERGVILSPPNLPGWDHIEIVRAKNMVFLTFGTGMGAGIILGGKIVNGANGNAGEIGHIRMQPYGPIGYGKMGSFEGFVSGGGIAMLARSLATERLQQGKTTAYCSSYAELERIDAKSVADAARQGDETANAVYRITGEMLGRGLSILVDLLNPERIVIGSIFGRAEELLRPHMERVMREECLPMSYGAVSVVPAGLGEAIGDLAALALAMSMNEG